MEEKNTELFQYSSFIHYLLTVLFWKAKDFVLALSQIFTK